MWIKGEVGGQHQYATACIGAASFRTNGFKGGDAGHGGFVEIAFDTERGSTALEATVNDQQFESVDHVTLRFRGDAEMEAALECIEYLARNLRRALGKDVTGRAE